MRIRGPPAIQGRLTHVVAWADKRIVGGCSRHLFVVSAKPMAPFFENCPQLSPSGVALVVMFVQCNLAPVAMPEWIKDAQLTQAGPVRLSFPEAELGTETYL